MGSILREDREGYMPKCCAYYSCRYGNADLTSPPRGRNVVTMLAWEFSRAVAVSYWVTINGQMVI
jgi:hypothetical protein